jgi:hypothetical protein
MLAKALYNTGRGFEYCGALWMDLYHLSLKLLRGGLSYHSLKRDVIKEEIKPKKEKEEAIKGGEGKRASGGTYTRSKENLKTKTHIVQRYQKHELVRVLAFLHLFDRLVDQSSVDKASTPVMSGPAASAKGNICINPFFSMEFHLPFLLYMLPYPSIKT